MADAAASADMPCVVVVGSASRDLTTEDARGWRLGGGVTYGALTLARLGIATGAIVGVDDVSADALELDVLRRAGVRLVLVPLRHAPVFENTETPNGRVQTASDASDGLPIAALPDSWRAVPAWLFAPVAAELPPEWAALPSPDATVGLGWQGLLRRVRAGERVTPIPPAASPFLDRAALVGVSVTDLPSEWPLRILDALVPAAADVLVTAGARGGLLFSRSSSTRRVLRYPAVSAAESDATGAGDVALAALLAARLADAAHNGAAVLAARRGEGARPRPADAVPTLEALPPSAASRRRHLLLAATAAAMTVEQPGILGVPTRAALLDRLSSRHP